MAKNRIAAHAEKWFDKFNDPSTAMFNIAHAKRVNSAPTFKPNEVAAQLKKTADVRMKQLEEAVGKLGKPETKTGK